jgi:hypothetical protein
MYVRDAVRAGVAEHERDASTAVEHLDPDAAHRGETDRFRCRAFAGRYRERDGRATIATHSRSARA